VPRRVDWIWAHCSAVWEQELRGKVLVIATCTAHQGKTKEKNPSHVPSMNGCGTDFLKVSDEFNFTPCCNKHDICYDTCNKEYIRDQCDDNFLKCMNELCAKKKPMEKQKKCEATANVYHVATTSFGCNLYRKSQQNACKCVGKKSEL